jgi:hypothetical protein
MCPRGDLNSRRSGHIGQHPAALNLALTRRYTVSPCERAASGRTRIHVRLCTRSGTPIRRVGGQEDLPVAATKKTPWPLQSMTGLLGHCAARPLPNDAPMSCQGPCRVLISAVWAGMAGRFLGVWDGALARGCWVADKTGRGRSGVGASSYEVTRSRSVMARGRPTNRSKASRCGSRISGQAAPGVFGVSRRRASTDIPRGRRSA